MEPIQCDRCNDIITEPHLQLYDCHKGASGPCYNLCDRCSYMYDLRYRQFRDAFMAEIRNPDEMV
jgi:hypothetical protein